MILDRETIINNETEADALHAKLWEEEKALIRLISPKNKKEAGVVLGSICKAIIALERFDLTNY